MNGRTNVTIGPNGGAIDIPLDPPTAFVAEGSHEKISLTWVDPKNKYATPEGEAMEDTDQLVSTWDHTVIVRKTDGYPATPDDGILVISSGQYNQYQSTPYIDTGLTNQTQYYYAAFAFNTDGVPSEPAYVDCFLYGYDTVLANNSWEYINRACSEGLHTSLWEIGDSKPVTIDLDGGSETFNMDIIDFDHDDLADGTGKAAITLCTHECTVERFNIKEGVYPTFGGSEIYPDSTLATYVESIYNKIEATCRSYIVNVTKQAIAKNPPPDPESFDAFVFILGASEIDPTDTKWGKDAYEQGEGYQYPYFTTLENRYKYKSDGTEFDSYDFMSGNPGYLLRTFGDKSFNSIGQWMLNYAAMTIHGFSSIDRSNVECHNVFCFCIDKSAV